MEQDAVIIVDYDPAWPEVFAQLKQDLLSGLATVAVAIEHIGSTAVPLLAAKPIIDIDVVVRRNDMALAMRQRGRRQRGRVHLSALAPSGRSTSMQPVLSGSAAEISG